MIKLRSIVGCLFVSVLATLIMTAQGPADPARAADPPAGGSYEPISPPFRLVNTATGIGGSQLPLPAGQTRSYSILGVGDVPATGVSAVVVDIAASGLEDAATSWLAVWSSGIPRPSSSVLRLADGELPRSNTIVVAPGADGKISVYNNDGKAHFNLDVQGYFTSTTGEGDGFVPISSTRVVSRTISSTTPVDIQITGEVIPSTATALFANIKVQGASIDGSLQMGAGGVSLPSSVTSMNFQGGGAYNDSGLTIKLDSSGRLRVKSLKEGASFGLYIDVQGYFSGAPETGGGFTPLSQPMIYDTRDSTPLASGATRTVNVASIPGIPEVNIGALALTVRASNWNPSGSIVVYNPDDPVPGTTTLSYNSQSSPTGLTTTGVIPTSAIETIAIKNTGMSAVDVTLSAQGWFAFQEAPDDDLLGEDVPPLDSDLPEEEAPLDPEDAVIASMDELLDSECASKPNPDSVTDADGTVRGLCIASPQDDVDQIDVAQALPEIESSAAYPRIWARPCWRPIMKKWRWYTYRKSQCQWATLKVYDVKIVSGRPVVVGVARVNIFQEVELNRKTQRVPHMWQYQLIDGSGSLTSGVVLKTWLRCDGVCNVYDPLYIPSVVTSWGPLSAIATNESRSSGTANHYFRQKLEARASPLNENRSSTLGSFPRTSEVRCENTRYLNTYLGGCVFYRVKPIFKLREAGRVIKSAEHIRYAQAHLSGHPGSLAHNSPLSRRYWGGKRNPSRKISCRGFRKDSPTDSCDEYPFASTFQGAYDAGRENVSVWGVPLDDNRTSGSMLGSFYQKERIQNGDEFFVKITN